MKLDMSQRQDKGDGALSVVAPAETLDDGSVLNQEGEESLDALQGSSVVRIKNRITRLNERLAMVTQGLVRDLERASRTKIGSICICYICIDEDPAAVDPSASSSIWFERVVKVDVVPRHQHHQSISSICSLAGKFTAVYGHVQNTALISKF